MMVSSSSVRQNYNRHTIFFGFLCSLIITIQICSSRASRHVCRTQTSAYFLLVSEEVGRLIIPPWNFVFRQPCLRRNYFGHTILLQDQAQCNHPAADLHDHWQATVSEIECALLRKLSANTFFGVRSQGKPLRAQRAAASPNCRHPWRLSDILCFVIREHITRVEPLYLHDLGSPTYFCY